MWSTVAIVLAVIVVIGIGGVVWLRSHSFNQASDLAKQVFPVWAAQGPFNSGAESAAAIRNAYLAVFGPDLTPDLSEEMAAAIEQHETAYDDDPTTWEENRRIAINVASSDALTLAEGIAAAEGLNKEFIEDGGHRLEFTRQPGGSVGLVNKKIWSDEDIEKKKEENNEAIVSGIGQGLLDDSESSREARELVEFLSDLYRAEMNEEPDASALGRIWLACFTMGIEKDEPEPEIEPELDPEILQTFKRLNEAHQQILEARERDQGDAAVKVVELKAPKIEKLILALLNRPQISPELTEDLTSFLDALRSGELPDEDAKYIEAVSARLNISEDDDPP